MDHRPRGYYHRGDISTTGTSRKVDGANLDYLERLQGMLFEASTWCIDVTE